MVTATQPALTQRQADILRFIQEHPGVPSYRELMRAFGISSPNGIQCHIGALEKKGYIEVDRNKARCIRPTGGPRVQDLQKLLTRDRLDGEQITIGRGRYRLIYLRPATNEEMA